jgi:uncharacterized phage protein (TIGR01671 family)
VIQKPRYYDEKLGMCEISWMEFTPDTSTYTANPFCLGGLTDNDGKVIKEIALYPKNIMQPAKLKDKNGTEIFEGDIVEQHYEYKDSEDGWHEGCRIGEVVIIASKGACIKNPIHEDECGVRQQCFSYTSICGERAKIIGNKHQNPGLLEQ